MCPAQVCKSNVDLEIAWKKFAKSRDQSGAHVDRNACVDTERERERERESWIWICLYLYLLLFCYLACIRSHFDLSSLCIWCFLMAATPPQAEAFRRPVSCCVNWDSAVWHLPPGTLACQANPVIQILWRGDTTLGFHWFASRGERERYIYIYNYIIIYIYIYEGLLLSVTRPLDVACLWVYKYHQIPLGISRNSPWYLEKYPLKSSKNTPSHLQKYPLTSRKIPLENFPKYPDAWWFRNQNTLKLTVFLLIFWWYFWIPKFPNFVVCFRHV